MPSWRLPDRKAFNDACKKYQKERASDKLSLQSEHNLNGVISDARNSSSTPNINSGIPIPHCSTNVITRSYSSPESTFQNGSGDGTTLTHISQPFDSSIRPSAHSSPSASHLTTELTPAEKLSRSMRVFVAWKASSS
jgi:hypothetical protein